MKLELTIEKLIYGGDGLARVDSGEVSSSDASSSDASSGDARRQVVFVPFTLPGEVVSAELEPLARGSARPRRARVLEILKPSPARVAPGCEYFGRCGGCQLQHASPEHQLALKREILLETLQRTGKVRWTGPVQLHAGPAWGYRNRIRLQRTPEGVGYYYRDSHRVLPVTHCPIASPEINRVLGHLAAAPAADARDQIELAANNDDQGLESDAPLEFVVAGRRYRVSPGSFFQVNRFLAGELVGAVCGTAGGEAAVDLFSGVGLFALALAERFRQVEAVESHPTAFADLRHNVGGAPVRVSKASALAFMRGRGPDPLDLLVADPPRAGLGPELVRAMVEAAPKRIHLVSCDPATLGRDLNGLLAAGCRIEALHLFDLFPQTYHLETVVELTRSGT